MFDRLRKALFGPAPAPAEASHSQIAHDQVSFWAQQHGMHFADSVAGTLALEGRVQGRRWRLEVGKSTRDYIQGDELRVRAELNLDEDVAAMVIGRRLKESLERRAFDMITDTVRTTADARMPEEMRWLAMFEDVGWEELPEEFWERYAVLAEKRANATAWVNEALATLLLDWPEPAPGPEVPFLLVLLRGKCYLRMAYEPADTVTLQHASEVFTRACERALAVFHYQRPR